jgi:NO-binding membrane sensor protein with MHYT domain
MQYFTMGTWVLGLSLGVTVAGTLVGLICIRQSELSVTAKFRLVWLTAAAVCIGAIGAYLAVSASMLGIGVSGGVVHYDLLRGAAPLVLMPVAVLAGLLIAGRTPAPPRIAGGGLIIGLALGLMDYLASSALDIQGTVTISPAITAACTVLSVVVGYGLLWATRLRTTLALIGVSVAFAAAIVGIRYLGLSGVSAHLDPAMPPPGGRDLFMGFIPVFAVGVGSLAVPITAVLVSPDRTGRLQPPPKQRMPRAPRQAREVRPRRKTEPVT